MACICRCALTVRFGRIWQSYIAMFVKILELIRPLRTRVSQANTALEDGEKRLTEMQRDLEAEQLKQAVLASEKKVCGAKEAHRARHLW